MDILQSFSAIFEKKDNIYDFLFASSGLYNRSEHSASFFVRYSKIENRVELYWLEQAWDHKN